MMSPVVPLKALLGLPTIIITNALWPVLASVQWIPTDMAVPFCVPIFLGNAWSVWLLAGRRCESDAVL